MFSNLLKGRSLASAEAVSLSDSLAVSIFERLFNAMDSLRSLIECLLFSVAKTLLSLFDY